MMMGENPVPSGELTFCHGKIHHFSWENPLFLWPFSIPFGCLPEGTPNIKIARIYGKNRLVGHLIGRDLCVLPGRKAGMKLERYI